MKTDPLVEAGRHRRGDDIGVPEPTKANTVAVRPATHPGPEPQPIKLVKLALPDAICR
jgi:hypothetical protein